MNRLIKNDSVLLDTSILMEHPDIIYELIDDYSKIYISYITIDELDNLKTHERKGYHAREALRKIKLYLSEEILSIVTEQDYEDIEEAEMEDEEFDLFSLRSETNDMLIVKAAKYFNLGLITQDLGMQLRAEATGVEVFEYQFNKNDGYTGYIIQVSPNELYSQFYTTKKTEIELLPNQYLICKNNKNEVQGIHVYKNNRIQDVEPITFTSVQFGKIQPKDEYQKCAMHSLSTNQITMIKGKAATGKTLLSLAYAMQEIEKGRYSKLIVFCNPVGMKNAAEIGFLKGSERDKLLGSNTGKMIIAKFGGIDEVNRLMDENKLDIMPFTSLRGFDTSGMKAIVWINEAQNLDRELIKTGIQRIGEDSKLIIDGDYNTQVDSSAYDGQRNGMRRVSEVFRGEDVYGEVELQNIYRSRLAEIAEKI